jgi:POT family proton-dependent oligopeptide transporter
METDDPRSIPDHLAPPRELVAARHPLGLATLFFTEMWERFSYYGMRALLVLFMVDAVSKGGLGLDDKTATAIYGLYTAAVYLMSLPGGWLADRLWGAQRAVWIGGIIIALGHFTLALPWVQTFYLGLIFVVIGSGTLKPNMSSLVAELYPEGGSRRDAGFTIFYMGVNVGAAIGPLVCGWLAVNHGWHWGFGAAGVGMVLGLVQFRLTRRWLGDAGIERGNPTPIHPAQRLLLVGSVFAVVVLAGLGISGVVRFDPVVLSEGMKYLILAIGAAFFLSVFLWAKLATIEKKRVGMIIVLFFASALFWAGFEQAGSSFNLFAERYTDRTWFGFEIPAAWFQTLGPVFIITLAPAFASLWVGLGRRHLDPSIPVKFGLGLLLLAAGFVIMAGAAEVVASGHKALPTWLIATYLVHTFGELCLSPVGLSSVTKLSPRKLVGQMMGTWFLATSLGNVIAGQLAGDFDPNALQQWPGIYLKIVILPAAAGLLLIVFAGPLKRLMPADG